MFNIWIFSLLFLVYSWWMLSKIIHRTHSKSTLSGLVFGFSVSSCAIITTSGLMWLIGNPLTLIQLGVVANALLIIAFVLTSKDTNTFRSPPGKTLNTLIDRIDVLALLVISLFLMAYVYSGTRSPGGLTPKIDAVQNTTKALDDQNHFTMFMDTLRANDGLEIGQGSQYQPNSLLSVYPKGIHTVAGVYAESVRPIWSSGDRNAPGTVDELYVYALLKLVFYLVTIFVLVRFSLEFCQRLTGSKKLSVLAGTAASAICLYIVLLYMTPLFMDGAFSFVPTFLFSALFILSCYAQPTNTISHKYILLGMMAASATLTWTIVGIPLFMILGLMALQDLLSERKLLSLKSVEILAPIALTALSALVQIYVQISGDVAVLNVNTAGGFFTIPLLLPLLMATFLIVASQKIAPRDQVAQQTLRISLMLLALLFLIAAGISLQNFNLKGEVQYYFIKLLYLPFVFSALLSASYVSYFIAQSSQPNDKVSKQDFIQKVLNVITGPGSLLVLLLSVLFIAFPPNLGVVDYYMKGHRGVGKHTARVLIDELAVINPDNSRAIFILSDTVPITENVMANHALNASSRGNLCQGVIFDALYAQKNLAIFNDTTIDKCITYKAKDIMIITDSHMFDDLPEKYREKGISIQITRK